MGKQRPIDLEVDLVRCSPPVSIGFPSKYPSTGAETAAVRRLTKNSDSATSTDDSRRIIHPDSRFGEWAFAELLTLGEVRGLPNRSRRGGRADDEFRSRRSAGSAISVNKEGKSRMEGERVSWRGENKRPPAFLALAVATMAVMGFGIVGAVALGTAVANSVTHVQASPGHLSAGISPALMAQLHVYAKDKVKKTTSGNWGGYADTAKEGTILEAYGEWQVPAITCGADEPAIQDNWVGIDGFSTGTVEQGGTLAYCTTDGGAPTYYDWFEFYPYEDIQFVFSGSIAGNNFQTYVLYQPYYCYGSDCGIYTILVEDESNAAFSFVVQGNPSICNSDNQCEGGPDGSAECISESLTGEGYYLPDYGTTTFATCQAVINGYHSGIGGLPKDAHATVYAITTIGDVSGKVQQSVSSLSTYDYTDDHFTITWGSYD